MGRQRKWCCGIAGCEGSRRKRLGERLASRHRYLLPAGPPVLRRPVEITDQSGQNSILAGDGLAANDPNRTANHADCPHYVIHGMMAEIPSTHYVKSDDVH